MKESKTSVPVEQGALKEMWEMAAKEFEKICGESLTRGEIKGFEDVQKRIEKASYEPDAEPEDKWDKAKNVGLKSLTYLKLLVGAVSQVSSFTPIPAVAANVTGSALNFVFDIPRAIKGYNDAVDEVFTRISSALSQFQIYGSMEDIDPALAKQIHLVLTSFVKLCAHVVKYRQGNRGARLFRQLKSIFDDDSGLADEMAQFEKVLQQQRDVEGTLTLAYVVETRDDVAILLQRFIIFDKTVEETHQVVHETQKGVQALKDDADRSKTLAKIRDALALDPRVRLDAKTTQTCTTIASRCLPGTGDWIWTHDAFKAWTSSAREKDASAPPLAHTLFLTGPPSSGKTSVAALIAKRLEKHKEEDRVYVAHYFFSPSTQRPDNAQTNVPAAPKNAQTNVVLAALKYMAFQIARVDPTVRKALTKLDDKFDGGLETLWQELKIGAPGSGAMHYLIFDGIECLSDEQTKMLLNFVFKTRVAGGQAGRVRVLLSGTNEKFEIHNVGPVEGVLRVRMEDHNEFDMRIFVKNELEGHRMLQNAREGSAQQRAYDKIVDKLPKNVKGSYSVLQFGLQAVLRLLGTRSAALELDKLLDQSMSSHEVAIKNLQRSLTTEEIRELNELLKWVLFSSGPLRLDQLEAVMFLFSNIEPLTSLQYIIENRYAAVLKVEGSCVVAQDGVQKYLEKEREATNPFSDSSTISMTIKINNVSQELCAHFLWDLAHKSIRDKFKFEFDGDMSSGLVSGGSRGVIEVDELEAHYTIVQRAFHYLRNAPQEQTAEIGEYLVCWLPFHLQRIWELQDNGKLTDEMRTDIGQNLYLLFRDGEVLLRHKDSFSDSYWTADEMKGLQKWMMDSAVTRKLDARWRDAVQQAPNPARGFMKEFATVLVKALLRERSWDTDDVCCWLEGFVSMDAGDTVTNWEQIGQWCQKFLDLPDTALDSLWYERLAEASYASSWWLGDPQVTRSLWQRAAEMKDSSWLCYRGLGLTYYNGNQLSEAIKQIELALQKAGQEGALPTPEPEAIINLHLLLGTYMGQIRDIQGAAKHYLQACESADPEQAKKGQLGHLKAQLGIVDAQERQEQLRSKLAAPGGEAQLVSILKSAACDPANDPLAFFSQLFTAVKSDQDLMQSIVQVLQVATPPQPLFENAPSVGSAETQSLLLYERGVAAYRYRAVASGENGEIEADSVAEALRLWHACRRRSTDLNSFYDFVARREATAALSTHYFQNVLQERLPDCFSELAELAADPGVQAYSANGDPVGFMAVVHRERRGEVDKAREALRPRMQYALQVLSDDIPDNDTHGLCALFKTLVHDTDFKNAGIALALIGPQDLVVEALHFEGQEIVDEAEKLAAEYVKSERMPEEDETAAYRRWVASREQPLVEAVKRLASETVQAAHIAVPDAAQQEERIGAAKTYIVNAQEVNAAQNADQITVIAHGLLRNRLDLLQSKPLNLSQWMGRCHGCAADGTRCPNTCEWRHAFYDCMYCTYREFCGNCLGRLRNPDADGGKIIVCDPNHKWLRYPPQGDQFYVGLRASRVRVPELRPVEGDERVFEFQFAEESEENFISVKDWKDGLAKDWGIEI
ncbi:hypothetical protein FB45DRAFT_156779 [Roridomyces roridus]|uniref:Fungal STAND N-terminal Goodbye domain-containing protein n=1 Tax=Roridomyces roridus TaxID=1738132 RepID=A0AAD7BF82_9AGAR|nr:hypothetical protein FB45DRAFT_156779 [Roridomyces roridus]